MTTTQLQATLLPETVEFLTSFQGLVIGNEPVAAKSGRSIDTIDPATGRHLATFALGDPEDVDDAVVRASAALEQWRHLSPQRRGRQLHKLADLIEARRDQLAELEVLDTGKPLKYARGEVELATATFRYYASLCVTATGDLNPTDRRFVSETVREPIGVCGLISAWNFPFLLASWKVAPALAFGNTAILKPPEQASLTSLRLGQLCLEAGLPAGVLSVVSGAGSAAGAALVEHPLVRKISFTGSTEVGKIVMRSAADTMKRLTLELGGKSPNIVLDDANYGAALDGAIRAIFWNSGQTCVAGSRLLVSDRIADQFLEDLVDRADSLKLGHGLDPDTDLGPMVSAGHQEKVLGMIERARADGARPLTSAAELPKGGFFVEPTILGDVERTMEIAQDEVFGPVLAVFRFADDDEAVQIANDSRFGLAAAVWSRDRGRADALAHRLDAGTVWVNCFGVLEPSSPFGGFKQSGLGRELGAQARDAYTEQKTIYRKSVI